MFKLHETNPSQPGFRPAHFPTVQRKETRDRESVGSMVGRQGSTDGFDKRREGSEREKERAYIFISSVLVHGRTDNEQMAGYVYARDFHPNWQANTSQRMQISRIICQSSPGWPRLPASGPRGHFNRPSFTIVSLSALFLTFLSFLSLHPPSRFRCVSPPIHPSVHPPSSSLFSPPCPEYRQGVTIKTPSVDSRYFSPILSFLLALFFSHFLSEPRTHTYVHAVPIGN